MKFNQKLAKRFLAVALSFAMVVTSLFVLPTEASAASGVTVTDYTSVKAGGTAKFAIKGLKSTQYAKVAVKTTNNVGTVDGTVTAKYADKKITSSTKIAGGKTRYIYVTNKNCVGETVTITVTVYNKSTNKKVDTVVEKVFVYKLTTSMSIKEADQTIKVGETFDFTGVKAPSNSTQKIKWTSSDTSVATVNGSGLVTGVAAGTATITATSGSKSASVVVTVKAAEAELLNVEATGAKELTLTLSETADVKAADLKVQKGSATPNIASVEVEGTKVIVTLGSKMTAGTYAVTYKEVTKEVTVKDETLTTLEVIGTNLVADANTAATATIAYWSLNQYGERMVAPGNVTATSTFGTANVTTQATAKKNGVITVTAIPTTLSVIGTTGSIVLVDSKTGVNSTATITYSASATLSKVEILGMLNMDTLKYEDIISGEDISDYVLVIKGYNQYGVEMDKDDMIADAGNIALTATPILSNVTITGTTFAAANMTEVEVDGTTYAALVLTNSNANTKAEAGSLNLTIVNKTKGILVSESFKITESVIVKSIAVSANDTVYANDAIALDYEILDQNGKEITSYAVLKDLVTFNSDNFEWSKNKDGSATLYYTGDSTGYEGNTDTYRMSIPVTETIYGNAGTTNLVVNTTSFTVFTTKQPVEVTGFKGLNACAAVSGESIELSPYDIVVEDQYGNVLDTYYEVGLSNIAYKLVVDNASGPAFTAANGTMNNLGSYYMYINSTGNLGTATLYLSLKDDTNGDVRTDVTKATVETRIAGVDASKATGLYIYYVNYGYHVNETGASVAYTPVGTLTKGSIAVYGRVGNYTIQIPTSMYDITGDTFKGFDKATVDAKNGLSTETVEVSVYTKDGTVVLTSEYVRSNKPAELTVLKFASTSKTGVTTIDKNVFASLLTTRDQYGNSYSTANAKYELTLKSAVSGTGATATDVSENVVISKNNTGNVTVTAKTGSFASGTVIKLYVTVTLEDKTVTKLVTLTMN